MCESYTDGDFVFINFLELTEIQSRKVWQVRNKKEIRQYMLNQTEFSFSEHCCFIERLRIDDTKVYFAVFKEEEFIGSVSLHPIDYVARKAEWGIYINPKLWHCGLSLAVAQSFLKQMFCSDSIDVITAVVLKKNAASVKFHEKVGFKKSGEDCDYVYFTIEDKL